MVSINNASKGEFSKHCAACGTVRLTKSLDEVLRNNTSVREINRRKIKRIEVE